MYDKLIQILVWEIVKPDRAMVMGGTWRIPVLMKLLDKNFVKDLQMDGTFNESSFEREYKNLYSINLVNCWELSLRQSAAKLAVAARKFNDYPEKEQGQAARSARLHVYEDDIV